MILFWISDTHEEAETGSAHNCAVESFCLDLADLAGKDGVILIGGDCVDDGSEGAWTNLDRLVADMRTRCADVLLFAGNHDYSSGGPFPGCVTADDGAMDRAMQIGRCGCTWAKSGRTGIGWWDLYDTAPLVSEGRYDARVAATQAGADLDAIWASHYNPLVTHGALRLHGGERFLRDAAAANVWLVLGGHAGGAVTLQDADGRSLGDVARYCGELVCANTDGCVALRQAILVDTDARVASIVRLP